MKRIKRTPENDTPRLVDAKVRCDYRDFQHCDVSNLDMHGVLVLGRDGTLTRLPKDAPVEVALKLNANGRTRTHVLHARVESKGRDGINLVFTSADIDTYSALLHLNLNE
ncbi:MAG: hypothetical protein H6R47_59 [Proteobacteria bacterium]|nr:hypothetical protein [Pseudomonadota bacterium]